MYGSRVADALQTGIKEGIIYGPMKKEDLPWDPKVSPMTVQLKPNGSARIIMDLSAPHGPTLGEGEACSPNMGMENFEEFEEVVMAGERKWRKCMYQAGRPCSMFKADWDMAYKHVAVRCEDHYLQVIEFGGRFFVERCLTFGGKNSPVLYYLPASLLRDWVEMKAGLDSRLAVMQLDDNCAASKRGSPVLEKYREEYRALAVRLGIRLASEDNPSKAFPPSDKGEILGMDYDEVNWTWNMSQAKRTRLLILIAKGIRQGYLLNSEARVLAGKVNHYMDVVGGKFERCLLIHLVKEEKGDMEIVEVGKQARSQLVWWLLNLRAVGIEGAFINDPDGWFPRWCVELYPDAAGGATKDNKKGWGCCYPRRKEYIRGVWQKYILRNEERNGRHFGKSLSFLEGVGGAAGLPAWVEEIVEAGACAMFIDNAGEFGGGILGD